MNLLLHALARHLQDGDLKELTLTTNGSQLAQFAGELANCGVRRINVSLDTLDPARFKAITRRGDFDRVLRHRRSTAGWACGENQCCGA